MYSLSNSSLSRLQITFTQSEDLAGRRPPDFWAQLGMLLFKLMGVRGRMECRILCEWTLSPQTTSSVFSLGFFFVMS